MKTYLIDNRIFLDVKHKLEGLVFWKQNGDKIEIKSAAPHKGLSKFLTSLQDISK